MWKIIAIVCMMEYPDYTMLPVLECHTFQDADEIQYATKQQCNIVAARRQSETELAFQQARESYESLRVYCIK